MASIADLPGAQPAAVYQGFSRAAAAAGRRRRADRTLRRRVMVAGVAAASVLGMAMGYATRPTQVERALAEPASGMQIVMGEEPVLAAGAAAEPLAAVPAEARRVGPRVVRLTAATVEPVQPAEEAATGEAVDTAAVEPALPLLVDPGPSPILVEPATDLSVEP